MARECGHRSVTFAWGRDGRADRTRWKCMRCGLEFKPVQRRWKFFWRRQKDSDLQERRRDESAT